MSTHDYGRNHHAQHIRTASGKAFTVFTMPEKPDLIDVVFSISSHDDAVPPGGRPAEVISHERRFAFDEERDGERYYREIPFTRRGEAPYTFVQFLPPPVGEMDEILRDRGERFFTQILGPRPHA